MHRYRISFNLSRKKDEEDDDEEEEETKDCFLGYFEFQQFLLHQIDLFHLQIDYIPVAFGEHGDVATGDETCLAVGHDSDA